MPQRRNSDILMTPDFRHFLIGRPGAADVEVRLGPHGDTCVDNAWNGADSPYVRFPASLRAAITACSPASASCSSTAACTRWWTTRKSLAAARLREPGTNEFPLAQSEGLAPLAKPAPNPNALGQNNAPPQVVEPLVYKIPSKRSRPPLHRLQAPAKNP